MTVTYSLNVSKARLCGFAKLLLRWRGSIYKLLYREMIIFCGLYYSLSALYRYILSETQRTVFEKLAMYCEAFTNLIPLSFVLGFYVSIVVGRWWQQYMVIPWPDKTCMLIAAYVHGNDERGRVIRRTLARYLSLLSVLTFQAVSTAVRKRFPTLDHIEEAGLMTKEERLAYDEIPVAHGKWWVPAQWFTALAVRARKEGRIKDDILLRALLDEMHVFRGNCGMLFSYDWISIPLVYTQVVTLAIYTYFIATVMGRQYLDPEKGYPGHEVDLYIPIFTILQFFFYMGWLKVAEQLINPFGEDDDDFELNWCLDRNLQVSFMIVDGMHQKHPRLVRDMYWDEAEPQLPYTKSSVYLRTQPHLGSAMHLDVDPEEAEFIPMETIMEEDRDDNNYNSPPTSPTNELVSPCFPIPDGSTKNLDGIADSTSTHSVHGMKFLSDFSGNKFLNMIMGSSSENVAGTPKKEHSFLPNFILKTPNRRSRTTSMAESLNTQSPEGRERRDDADSLMQPMTPGSVRREISTPDERRSLMIDMTGTHHFHDVVSGGTGSIPEGSPASMMIDELIRRTEGNRQSGSNFSISKVPTDEKPSPAETSITIESHPHPEPPRPPTPSPYDPNTENALTYEPNSSQESLTPYVDSNQSTINSYTELLKNHS